MELERQLVIDLQPRSPVFVDPDDLPEPGDFPEHRWTRATECEAPKVRGPASIWDYAARRAA